MGTYNVTNNKTWATGESVTDAKLNTVDEVTIASNVTGPASSTASAIALYSNTGGEIIKDSAKTITPTNVSSGSTDATVPTSEAVFGGMVTYVATQAVSTSNSIQVGTKRMQWLTSGLRTTEGLYPTLVPTGFSSVDSCQVTTRSPNADFASGAEVQLKSFTTSTVVLFLE